MVYEGNQKLGDLFISRREKGKCGLPTLSVTLTEGLVNRESLERKTDTNLAESEHLLVKEGDVVYNMMRMWQGASGRAEKDGLVSPAYIVLAPTEKADSLFAAYLFKTQRMIYLFWAYSYGLTSDRLRLYFSDFSRIPVDVPRIEEQRKIAQILSTWDKAIETTEKLIENSKAQKKALMQQLLTGKKRLPGYETSQWKQVRLDKICKFLKGCMLSKEKLSEDGKHKCILYGELYTRYGEVIEDVVNRTDVEEGRKSVAGDVLIPASTTTTGIDLANATSLKEDDVLLSGDINILRPDASRVNSDFLAYVLTHVKKHDLARLAQGITIIHLYGKDLKPVAVEIPLTVEEQDAIVSILSSAEKQIGSLGRDRSKLVAEKKALMQKLLTGKKRVKVN